MLGESSLSSVPSVAICHSARLIGESLQRGLVGSQSFECQWVCPESALAKSNSVSREFELFLLDASLAPEKVAALVVLFRRSLPGCKFLLLVPDTHLDQLVWIGSWKLNGCVRESSTLDELCRAIRLVLAGGCYYPPEMAAALFDRLHSSPATMPSPAAEFARLTAREREVLQLIAEENLPNKQIAHRLHVSLYTVKNHVHSVIEKLGVNNRQDAVRIARRRLDAQPHRRD
jgi:DNA-binding NarL/FixJ family response regulator